MLFYSEALSSIAAIADRHFHVSKQVIGDRTQVQIRLLELEERKKELAQIASGKTIEEGKNQGKGKKEKVGKMQMLMVWEDRRSLLRSLC